jgi:hypothetical protein
MGFKCLRPGLVQACSDYSLHNQRLILKNEHLGETCSEVRFYVNLGTEPRSKYICEGSFLRRVMGALTSTQRV